MKLIEKNKHPRDSRIRFDEEPHLYYIDGSTEGYISVTTLIHSFFQEFNPDEIIDKMMKSQNWTNSKYFGMTKFEIKKQWEDNGDVQSSLGTELHLDIENFYNNVEVKNDSKEFKHFLKYYDDHKNLTAYRTEWEVFEETLKLAGSIDMLYQDENGDYHICDWKRAKGIRKENHFNKGKYPLQHLDDTNFWHYSLQLNIYKKLLKLNYGIDVKSMFLVQLHPNYLSYNKFMCPNMDREVELAFAQRLINVSKELKLTSKIGNVVNKIEVKSNVL